jgi:hypothetical protein
MGRGGEGLSGPGRFRPEDRPSEVS